MYLCTYRIFLGRVGPTSEVSHHPPHLIDSSGSLTPAALIPFCSYQTSMNLLGKEKEGINFTFCNQFKPNLFDRQLCYSLNLSSMVREKTVTGKRAGLVFLPDAGVKTNDETHFNQNRIENALDL